MAEQLKPGVWSEEEKRMLLNDGVIIWPLSEKTISQLLTDQPPLWYISTERKEAKEELLDVSSKVMEIAFYIEPLEQFVPGSFNKAKDDQEKLMMADRDKLRTRLGINNLDVIFPEAQDVIQIASHIFIGVDRGYLVENVLSELILQLEMENRLLWETGVKLC